MTKFYIPRRFLAFLAFAFFNAFIFTVLRIIFYFVNAPEQIVSAKLVLRAFLVGARFDLRIAFLFALPLGILFLLPYKKWRKKIFSIIYALAFAVVIVIYFIDFGYYAYLKERLNAYIVELASNTFTSLEMVWQTYPVLKGFFALCIIAVLYYFFVSKLFVWAYSRTSPKKHYWYALPALLIAAAFVHGRVSQYPLRWSNAYFSSDNFVSSLALNPVQNLFDTYTFAKKGSGFNKEETRKYYDIVADYLGVTDKDKERLNFVRNIPPARGGVKNYNVVIILTESLSYDKTSFAIGEIDTTPNAFALAKRGVLFENFFTPTTGTARGVFTSITGLPDTSAAKTSSRNPTIVNQHSLINDLKGYNKFYFIGGSTNWGNVRGLLQHNIEGLKIFEEGTYEGQSRTDVWGISDLDMFRYAAKELQKTQKPFFAFLQTAGFHRPYTIPKDRGSFEVKTLDEDLLKSYGFSSNAEYNSIRFQDYALGEFFKIIENDDFYKNTIFFIYGDHGLSTRSAKNTPQAMLDLELVQNHSPLIVIGPDIKAGIDKKAASQADITATMAGLLGVGYKATAIGRDLFDASNERGAFILNSSAAPLRIGFVENGFYYTDWPNKKAMIKYESQDSKTDMCPEYPQQCERMKNLTRGLYETSRYITFNHK